MLPRGTLASLADRLLQAHAVDLHAAADPHVVDRDAGVLAEQVLRLLRDRDIADHGGEHPLGASIGLALRERVEALLHIGRQLLQRANVELLRGFLDLLEIDLHWTLMFLARTTFSQFSDSERIALANSCGELATGKSPCA